MILHTALFYTGSSRAGSCNSLLQLIQSKSEPFAVEERSSQAPIKGGSPCDWAGTGEMHAWCVEKGQRFRQPVAAGSESQEGYGTPKTLEVTVLPTEDRPRQPDRAAKMPLNIRLLDGRLLRVRATVHCQVRALTRVIEKHMSMQRRTLLLTRGNNVLADLSLLGQHGIPGEEELIGVVHQQTDGVMQCDICHDLTECCNGYTRAWASGDREFVAVTSLCATCGGIYFDPAWDTDSSESGDSRISFTEVMDIPGQLSSCNRAPPQDVA